MDEKVLALIRRGEDVEQCTNEVLLVNRSGGMGFGGPLIKRLELTALNTDCPESPVAAVVVQAVKMPKKDAFIDATLSVVLRGNPESIPGINERLKDTGIEISSSYSHFDDKELSVQYLKSVAQRPNFAYEAHYGEMSSRSHHYDNTRLQNVLRILREKGIIGDNILRNVTRFGEEMEKANADGERVIIDVHATVKPDSDARSRIEKGRETKLLPLAKGITP